MFKLKSLTLVCVFFMSFGVSAAFAQVDCTGVPTWDPVVLYLAANHDRVQFQGRLYESIVDSRVAQPQPGGNTWWRDLGACGSAPPQPVSISGAWTAGLTHAAASGANRALVLTAHTEHDGSISLNSVTYGGRPMTKIIERTATTTGSATIAYTAAFILNEAGIAAATNGNFVVTWSTTPTQTPAFSSVFLINVNQAALIGASAGVVSNAATAATSPLATASGDRVIVAATCGNSGSFTLNNGFVEALELAPASADGVAGSKAATEANETPSVTHSAINRQSVIAFVVRGGTGGANNAPRFTSNPIVKPTATVNQAYSSSIAADATDPDGDPLTFAKVSGPAWLSVGSNGALSGSPGAANVGLNTFTVSVADNRGGTATGSLNITVANAVNNPPFFNFDPFTKPNATVGVTYSQSIVADATDRDGDQLTFAKVSGPGWLTVAGNGTISGAPAAANLGLNTFVVSVTDNRGGSPDTATMNITVQNVQQGCSIPRRIIVGYWANFGGAAFFPLRQVSPDFDVINVAFGLPRSFTDPTIQFVPDPGLYPTPQGFAGDVAMLQQQGKKVVLSIGGASGGAFELTSDALRNTFVNSVFNLITTYGFDGIDIDFEGGGPGNPIIRDANDNDIKNPTSPRIRNAILALREIRNRFTAAFPGRCFILSFAPETFFLQAGFQFYASATPSTLGCYLPVIDALRDITTYVQTQDYNTGSMLGLDGVAYNSANADFHVAMSELLLRGFQVGNRDASPNPNNVFAALREDQVVIGLPASPAAAGSGFTPVAAVQNALRYLIQRTDFAGRQYTLQKPTGAYPNFRGLMTWNANHDVNNGFEFSRNHRAFLDSLP